MKKISLLRLAILAFVLLLVSCSREGAEAPKFELRDFVVKEEKKDATTYSKEWNTFTGKGILVARNIEKNRNMIVFIQIKDESMGVDAEPAVVNVLIRGGIGKIEIAKSNYNNMSTAPKYQWSVIGWSDLLPATIEVVGSTVK